MNVAYVEMIGGASGNMLLGAFIDAGADPECLEAALRTIPVAGWTLERKRVTKCGIGAQYAEFRIPGEDHARHAAVPEVHALHAVGRGEPVPDAALRATHAIGAPKRLDDVLHIVERSGLTARQKSRAGSVYTRLAHAETTAHGTTLEQAHFHEVGATDAILDVAATCVALDELEIDEVWCSAFPLGRGSIEMRHGRYPNPPPATADLLRGAPTYDAGIEDEMVTTTAAAILTTLATRAGARPAMRAQRIGYGAGRSDFPIPNVTRISIGPAVSLERDADHAEPGTGDALGRAAGDETLSVDVTRDEVCVVEANVDDMSPQRFELALERTLAAGAFDVWLAPLTMKKSRPGILFGAVAPLEAESRVARAMLAETTTLGVRVRRERRYVLPRTVRAVETAYGTVRVKEASYNGEVRRTLEYDDVARIARERNLPFAVVAQQLEDVLRAP